MRYKRGLLIGLILVIILGLMGCKGTSGGIENKSEETGNTVDSSAESAEESESTEETNSSAAGQTKDLTQESNVEPVIYKPTAEDIVNDIIIGWNLGNSLDSYSDKAVGLNTETSWGNPKVTKELIDMVKEAGFNAVRVPVTWYNHMDLATNTIDEAWMDRVEEVVNYVLDNDMYCILNVHHDTGEKGWLRASGKDLEMKKERFKAIWEQIAERFGDYDDKLLFESFNEILDDENHWTRPQTDALNITNELNQVFVDTIRASGKKNLTRCLIVNTYAASANRDIIKGFVLPSDQVSNKLIVEAHIYQPYHFTSETSPETTTWGVGKTTLEYNIKNMYTTFVEKGIPVIIGEFGAVDKNNSAERQSWLKYYVDTCTNYGIKCFWWDNGSEYRIFDRRNMTVTEPELIEIMLTEASGGDYILDRTLYGDADGNGSVNEEDLVLLQKYLKGEIDKVDNCDMNKDGITDAADEELLIKKLEEEANLCSNPNNWSFWVNVSNGATAEMNYVENGVQVEATKPGINSWDVQISYKNLTFEKGASYKISFDYKGSPAQSMPFHIMQDYGDYKTYSTTTLDYKEESQHYEGVFKMTESTDNRARITFDCGASKLDVPYNVVIENLVIVKVK